MSEESAYEQLIKIIAQNIRQKRIDLGLTQSDMENFGFQLKNYQKIEYASHHFSLHTVFRLSRAFKCPITDLICEKKISSTKKKSN